MAITGNTIKDGPRAEQRKPEEKNPRIRVCEASFEVSHRQAEVIFPILNYEANKTLGLPKAENVIRQLAIPGFMTIENLFHVEKLTVERIKTDPVQRQLPSNLETQLAQTLMDPSMPSVRISFTYHVIPEGVV